jgi:hypothetical protein
MGRHATVDRERTLSILPHPRSELEDIGHPVDIEKALVLDACSEAATAVP